MVVVKTDLPPVSSDCSDGLRQEVFGNRNRAVKVSIRSPRTYPLGCLLERDQWASTPMITHEKCLRQYGIFVVTAVTFYSVDLISRQRPTFLIVQGHFEGSVLLLTRPICCRQACLQSLLTERFCEPAAFPSRFSNPDTGNAFVCRSTTH